MARRNLEDDNIVYINTSNGVIGLNPNEDNSYIANNINVEEMFLDNDGYYKKLLNNGSLAVQDVDNNGNPIKHERIGSKTKIPKKGTVPKAVRDSIKDMVNAETRSKYWQTSPIVRHAVDSIANIYDIDSSMLYNRLDFEGYTDAATKYNNTGKNASGYNQLNHNLMPPIKNDSIVSPGFAHYGLDDSYTMIKDGRVKPINVNYTDSYNINEHNRKVHTADGKSVIDNISLQAATLKHFRDLAAKRFPNASRDSLNNLAIKYYNAGASSD